MRNASQNNSNQNFYGRFLNSVSNDFDYKLLKKTYQKDTFSKIYKQREKIK